MGLADHEATVPHRPGSAEPLAPVPEIASEATVPHRPAVHTRICPMEQQVPSLHAEQFPSFPITALAMLPFSPRQITMPTALRRLLHVVQQTDHYHRPQPGQLEPDP